MDHLFGNRQERPGGERQPQMGPEALRALRSIMPAGGGGLGDLPPDYQWSQSGSRVPGGPGPVHQVQPPQGDQYGRSLAFSEEQRSLIEALDEVLSRKALVRAELAPHIHPPFRGIPLDEIGEAVFVNTIDADVSLSGFLLEDAQHAWATTTSTIPTIVQTALGQFGVVQQFTVPRSYVAIIRCIGVKGHHWLARRYVLWRARVGDRLFLPPTRLGFVSEPDDPAPTFAIANEGMTISLEAASEEEHGPVLVQGRFCGWLFPVSQLDDSLRSLLLGNERGPYERRFDSAV